jgi:toxin HigB-1
LEADERFEWQIPLCWQHTGQEYWREAGYDPTAGESPPFNLPKPLRPHQHENGFDSRCGLCNHSRAPAQERQICSPYSAARAATGSLACLTSVTRRITVQDDRLDPPQRTEAPLRGRDVRGINREHLQKVRDILVRLDAAGALADMDVPGFKLHPLKGDLKGFWAITVRANWRVIFRFADGDALDVDYVDYH